MFSEVTRAALGRAGWRDDRVVDVVPFERALRAEGYDVPDHVRRFLAAYGGLHVSLPHPRFPRITIQFHFDAAQAASGIYREKLEALAERTGAALCPIGEGYGAMLVMDTSGRVYAVLDDWLAKVGETGADAIETMCTNRDLIVID
jgi:hypothetical protein